MGTQDTEVADVNTLLQVYFLIHFSLKPGEKRTTTNINPHVLRNDVKHPNSAQPQHWLI